MEEDKIKEVVDEEIRRRRKNFLKKASIPVMIILLVGLPAVADINIRDSGELILHGDTGIDLRDSDIHNISGGYQSLSNALASTGSGISGTINENTKIAKTENGSVLYYENDFMDHYSDKFEHEMSDGVNTDFSIDSVIPSWGYVESMTANDMNVKTFEGTTSISGEYDYCSISKDGGSGSCSVSRSGGNWELNEGATSCEAICMEFDSNPNVNYGGFVQRYQSTPANFSVFDHWGEQEHNLDPMGTYVDEQNYRISLDKKVKNDGSFKANIGWEDGDEIEVGRTGRATVNKDNECSEPSTYVIEDPRAIGDGNGYIEAIEFDFYVEMELYDCGPSTVFVAMMRPRDHPNHYVDYQGNS